MKISIALLLSIGYPAVIATGYAADFKQSKVTQVVNEVQIIDPADQAKKNAVVNDLFKIPDILRTGPASRAELVAQDDTVTRVGANTIFSFDPASRTIDLKQGSLLFHSPHGKGGGSIHTGSATASVLGSSLIVTATPNGGFKVICLEDKVYIQLPNGLHQQLFPGQLTYILPGSDHLAPIILFQLNDLVTHSLLLIGFNHPLPGLQLILQEIERQNKLIKSGKETDTGLLAGDYATPDQVQVLDPNTIQTTVNPTSQAQQAALTTDATINQPSLTSPDLATPHTRIFFNPGFSLAGNSFFAGRVFKGFAARNIYFNTTAENPLSVNLSAYSARHEMDIVASQNLNLQGSTTFAGLASKNSLYLVAGNQIVFSPDINLQANVGNLKLVAPGMMTLDSVNVINNSGNIGLASASTINLNNTSIEGSGHVVINAPTAINITGGPDIELDQPGDNSLITSARSGEVTIGATPGKLTVMNTSIQAHFLTLNSGDSILLDAKGRTLKATGAGATANFTAPNLVTVNNANLTSYQILDFASKTLVFVNDHFGIGKINLATEDGTYASGINNNNPVTYGKANFISGNTWNGMTIRDDSATLSSGQVHISNTSFHISKLP
jgi:hypothetical protein